MFSSSLRLRSWGLVFFFFGFALGTLGHEFFEVTLVGRDRLALYIFCG